MTQKTGPEVVRIERLNGTLRYARTHLMRVILTDWSTHSSPKR
jgi:hypothetical protein